MKFLRFHMMDWTKAAEVAKISDKTWASPPPGDKLLASYACLGIPFPGAPANTIISITIHEAESTEALGATAYPLALAGVSVWNVPVMEVPVPGATEVERKMRG